jgi:hypothetical protein
MMDGFGNYVMQKLIDHATVEQMALLVPTLRDHISELAENKISNYPLQKIIQFVSKRINSPSLSEDVARRFRYFLEDLLEAIQSRMKELCCHQVGTRVVQCMVEHFPDSWKDRILRDLLRYFDDLATNYYGSFVLNDALKHCHEDFLESLSSKVMLRLSDYSNDQYASIFIKYLLESKRFRVNLAWELINQNFRGNDTTAVIRLLNSNFGHQVLKKLIISCEEDQRKAIQSFVDSHRDELTRTQHGSMVLSSLYDASNHRGGGGGGGGPPAYGAPPLSFAPPSYGGDYGRSSGGGDRDRERRSRSRDRYAPPPPFPPSTGGDAYGHKRKRSASRSPHRSDPRRDDYRGSRDPYYPSDPYYPPPPPSSHGGYDYDRRRRFFLCFFFSLLLTLLVVSVCRSPSPSSRYPPIDDRRPRYDNYPPASGGGPPPSSYPPRGYDSRAPYPDNRDIRGGGDYRPRPQGERVNYSGKTLRDVTGTIATIVNKQEGSRFIQRLIDEGTDENRKEIFDEVYPQAKTIMMDGFGNYVMQKLIDHATVDQMVLLVPTLKDNILELAENRISNYPLQKIIQFVSKRLNASASASTLPEEYERKFRYFFEDMIESVTNRLRELSCHQIGTRVIQCMVEYFPDLYKERILSSLLRYFDDLAKNYYGSYVLNDALKHCHETFLESISIKVQSKLLDYSNDQYASMFIKQLLDNKRYRNNVITELISLCFNGNDTFNVVRMLNNAFAHQVLKKLMSSCENEEQLKTIQGFIESHRDELSRTQYGTMVIGSLYDALTHLPTSSSSGGAASGGGSPRRGHSGDYDDEPYRRGGNGDGDNDDYMAKRRRSDSDDRN